MPTISEPEPEQAAVEAAAVELVKLLETDHQEVVEQALEAVLGYSDAPEGIALLRDLPPPTDAPQTRRAQSRDRSCARMRQWRWSTCPQTRRSRIIWHRLALQERHWRWLLRLEPVLRPAAWSLSTVSCSSAAT